MPYEEKLDKLKQTSDALLDSLDIAVLCGFEACEVLTEFRRDVLQLLDDLGKTSLDALPAKLQEIRAEILTSESCLGIGKELVAAQKEGHDAKNVLCEVVDALYRYDPLDDDSVDDDSRTTIDSDDETQGTTSVEILRRERKKWAWPWKVFF